MIDLQLWVFGYGSLIWQPGFEVLERRPARLTGYRRGFVLRSVHHRGTEASPGLVLGLDWAPGAGVTGMAFRICPTLDRDVRAYLTRRELVTRAYFEVTLTVRPLDGGAPIAALAYIVDRTHAQYAGGLDLDEQAAIIARSVGASGTNWDYLYSTAAHMDALGIEDPDLADLAARVRALRGD